MWEVSATEFLLLMKQFLYCENDKGVQFYSGNTVILGRTHMPKMSLQD